LYAIKADVASHFSESDLSVAAVAARHSVTPRYIHKLFETEGATFSEYVLACRLDFAHRLLTIPRLVGRPITSVAFDAGFSDLSHFNRMFRRRYNATPTEVRAAKPS
jgi:AraC-like DNA-binding protein